MQRGSDSNKYEFVQCVLPDFDFYECEFVQRDSDFNKYEVVQCVPDFVFYKCEFV